MVLQVELVLPDRDTAKVLRLQPGEVGTGGPVLDRGIDVELFQPVDPVKHLQRRPAAMVADAEQDEHLGESGIGIELPHPVDVLHRVVDGADVVKWKVAQDPRSVRRLPPEEPVGEHVGLVPADLLCDEGIDARVRIEHRHVQIVAEGIGVPADGHVGADGVAEILFAEQQLVSP